MRKWSILIIVLAISLLLNVILVLRDLEGSNLCFEPREKEPEVDKVSAQASRLPLFDHIGIETDTTIQALRIDQDSYLRIWLNAYSNGTIKEYPRHRVIYWFGDPSGDNFSDTIVVSSPNTLMRISPTSFSDSSIWGYYEIPSISDTFRLGFKKDFRVITKK